MSRPLRIEYPGAWYHVMNRGANRRLIFNTDHHRRLFLGLLSDLWETFHVETHAYCLMGNHYHLLLHTPHGNLSRVMRHVNGLYTQRYNRDRKSDGPLFRGRYKAIVVDQDNYLLQVSRYIHRNPLEAGTVKRLLDYRWSSFPAYVGKVGPPPWLSTALVLSMVGQHDRQRRYQAYVAQCVNEELQTFYQQQRLPPVLGDDAFRRELAKRQNCAAQNREIPQAQQRGPRPTLDAITDIVANIFGIRPNAVRQSTRGRGKQNLPRLIAMTMARKHAGYRLDDIAAFFGVSHYSTVSVAANRLLAKMKADRQLKRKVDQVRRTMDRK